MFGGGGDMRTIEEIKADIEKAKHCEKIRNKSRNICNNSPCKTCEFDTVSICRLNEELLETYKEAERDGRLVLLPCKVGDTVYEPFAGKVYEKTVDRIIINRFTTPQIWIETKLPFATPRLERWDMAIGKTVFLTREEAEKALKGGAE
jgi:hypothetical protein